MNPYWKQFLALGGAIVVLYFADQHQAFLKRTLEIKSEWLIIIPLIAAAIFLYRFKSRNNEQVGRKNALMRFAEGQGYEYQSKMNDRLPSFSTLNRQIRKKFQNFILGEKENLPFKVFDFSYINDITYEMTIAVFKYDNGELPLFSMKPEVKHLHKLGEMIGLSDFKDIDFDSHPIFSEKYLLTSPDEEKTRSVFQNGVIDFLENSFDHWILEGEGKFLICHNGQLQEISNEVNNMERFIEDSAIIAKLVFKGKNEL